MPKIIENLRETILQQSRQLLLESGYDAFTMRNAAQRCKIAVGTLYNYFSSKEELAGSILLEDWQAALAQIKKECDAAADWEEGLTAAYCGILRFCEPYRGLWEACGFAGFQNSEYARRHQKLARQLAASLRPLLEKTGFELPAQTDLFLAENILLCAGNSEMSFSAFQQIARHLLKFSES